MTAPEQAQSDICILENCLDIAEKRRLEQAEIVEELMADRDSWKAAAETYKKERDALHCCCKCFNSDHDYRDEWWCEFDEDSGIPGDDPRVDPHETCHFTPSRWTKATT